MGRGFKFANCKHLPEGLTLATMETIWETHGVTWPWRPGAGIRGSDERDSKSASLGE